MQYELGGAIGPALAALDNPDVRLGTHVNGRRTNDAVA
jgi:hypothetical protein